MEAHARTMICHHKPLYLREVAGKGLGVFCTEDIFAGDLIDSAPVIFFNAADAVHIDQTQLYNYYFSTAFLPEKTDAKAGCLAMGMVSFCNHADMPNALVEKIPPSGQDTAYFHLRAIRDIPAGDEILTTYGKLWFTPAP